jgi:hypothetical protein
MPVSGNVLVVEGKDDLHSVVSLMKAHVPWPEGRMDVPVGIRHPDPGGKDAILAEGYLIGLLKERRLRTLGVMLDADNDAQGCHGRIRHRCSAVIPNIPMGLPAGGLIVERDDDHPRFGVWVMPDNTSHGDLETFLRYLVPDSAEPVWAHAVHATTRARELGAGYREAHLAKARIHTWLAWQDPPGKPFGLALTEQLFDRRSPKADPFVRWFRQLYGL